MKSRFRSGRGISATPDTVRSAVSGRRSSATAARYPAQYQARGRIPPPGTAADASPARAASGRTVFRPGDRMPVRHSTRTFSTHSYAPRRIDARTSTPNFRSGQNSDIT